MGLLDQLFGLSGSNSNDWVSQMQQQMSGGPLVGPAAASGGSSMVGAQRAMPGSTPPQAGQRKMFPAPDAPKMDEGPTMKVGAAPMTEAPSVGTYLSGALRGFGGEGGGSGILGAISGAMNAGDQVTRQNELYQTLTANGVEPRTAQLLIKQPGAYKVIESMKAQRQEQSQQNATISFLKKKHGMTDEQALAVASNPAALLPYLKPTDRKEQLEIQKLEQEVSGVGGAKRRLENIGGRLIDLTDPANPVDVTPKEKLEERMSFEQNKVDLKTVDRYVKDAEDADSMLGDVLALEAARAETSREGPTFGIIPKDYLPDVTPTAQRIASTAENVRLSFVQKTKGAVSDAEMKVFGAATPTMGMADSAAQPILDFMKLGAQRTKERASFFDAWMRTKGSLSGSQEAWKRFTEENPLLAKTESGVFELNPQNVGNWEGYLTGEATSKPKSAAAPTDKAAQAEAIRKAMRGGK